MEEEIEEVEEVPLPSGSFTEITNLIDAPGERAQNRHPQIPCRSDEMFIQSSSNSEQGCSKVRFTTDPGLKGKTVLPKGEPCHFAPTQSNCPHGYTYELHCLEC